MTDLDDLRFVAWSALDGTYRACCLMCDFDGPRRADESMAAADLLTHVNTDAHTAMVAEWADHTGP